MEIREIESQEAWDTFFEASGSESFLQSWEWGEFNIKDGHKIFRLGIYDGENLIGLALTILIASKRGVFLHIPHGPALDIRYDTERIKAIILELRDHLITIAKRESCAFIRIGSTLRATDENVAIFREYGFTTSPIYMHSERMWELLLDGSEEKLLQDMRKTTRYLINKAKRDNVEIVKRTDTEAVADFMKLYKETVKREQFVPFSEAYVARELEVFKQSGNALFLFAKHEGEYLAGALIIFTASRGFYHQGASIHTKIPATYALQWEAIREAKRRGCNHYSFWGIQKDGRTPRNWQGLTLFKQGFGGTQIDYVPTQDYVVSRGRYLVTSTYERYLAWKRGV